MGHQRVTPTQTSEANQRANAAVSRQPMVPSHDAGHSLLQLHHLIGNHALGRFIQAKLKINEPGDVYEQEADRVAEQVMRMPEPTPQTLSHDAPSTIQRKCAECASGGGLCPKCAEEEEKMVQRKPLAAQITPLIQRQATDEPEKEEETLQAKEVVGGAPALSPAVESHINGMRSGGQPLSESARTFFEPRFGYDFSQVRVHANQTAAQSASDVNALAYTVGPHVVFGSGQYAPTTMAGRRLLAHELTHVVQQANSRVFSDQSLIQREPTSQKKDEGCNIKNAKGFIYFEIPRRFKDPNDPQVLKRANCLKEAFGMLSADDAVEFAQKIIKKDPNWFYSAYETLAMPTRIAIAEILVDILKRKDTETYLARLLFATAVTPYDGPKIEQPAIVTAKVKDGKFLQITLDKPVLALAAAEILGDSECEKYTFGFTQFVTDDYFIADYYDSKLKNYMIIDNGANLKSSLPCQDVFHDGDVWSYSTKLECGSKQAVKKFGDIQLAFLDTPSQATALFPDNPQWELRGVKWIDKFVTVFSVMLPNGVVRHLSWFDWRIDYCENKPLAAIGKRPSDLSGRQVTINSVRTGEPPFPFVKQVGKPAAKACNTIVRNIKPDIFALDSALIKCH